MISERGVTIQVDDVFIYGKNLEKVNVIQQIDKLSSEIPISTCNFILVDKENLVTLFSFKKMFKVFFDGKLKAVMFVTSIEKVQYNKWLIQGEDYISFLEDTTWYGNSYENANAVSLLEEAFQSAGVPVEIDASLTEKTITGNVDIVTCREFVMQICFVIGAVVSTAERENVSIAPLKNNTPQIVEPKRIMEGAKLIENDVVTSVGVNAFGTRMVSETYTIEVNNFTPKIAGEIIDLYFAEPQGKFEVYRNQNVNEPGRYYEILKNSAFYFSIRFLEKAVEDGNNWAILAYKAGDFKKNLFVKKNEQQDVGFQEQKDVRITTARLVNNNNAEEMLEKLFDELIKNEEIHCKIVEGKHVQEGNIYKYGEAKYGTIKYGEQRPSIIKYDEPVGLGDIVEIEIQGYKKIKRIVKQSYALNGNIIVKDCILK